VDDGTALLMLECLQTFVPYNNPNKDDYTLLELKEFDRYTLFPTQVALDDHCRGVRGCGVRGQALSRSAAQSPDESGEVGGGWCYVTCFIDSCVTVVPGTVGGMQTSRIQARQLAPQCGIVPAPNEAHIINAREAELRGLGKAHVRALCNQFGVASGIKNLTVMIHAVTNAEILRKKEEAREREEGQSGKACCVTIIGWYVIVYTLGPAD
jgi:hypothetical protein